MKVQVFFFLLFFVASDCFSQTDQSSQDFSNVYHHWNNISLKNFDGTRSTIYVNGNSATLVNSDGTQSTIDFCEDSSTSTLIAVDGTSSLVFHNAFSSTIFNSDGTQVLVNHMISTSSCSTANGKHTVMHIFGNMVERRYKNKIDVLIHSNWLLQKKAIAAAEEFNEEHQN